MNQIKNSYSVFIIGGLICLINYFRIEIGSNQEIYMALAKWWANPSWIPESFYFSDPPGTRIGFVALLYPFWNLFSFEQVSLGASFFNLFILGGAWFLILKETSKLSFLYIVMIHLTLFSGLAFLSFYAGEWMFGPSEPKTFAYFFGLMGIYYFLRKKSFIAFVLLGIAAYFHVLVAGWILSILLLELLFSEGIKKSLSGFLIFILSIIPLFLYLVSEYFQAGLSSFKGADEIFISSLNNHLRPWTVAGKESRFYTGLILSLFACAVAAYRYKKCPGNLKIIYRLSIFSFIVPTILLLFAPWDWFNPFLKLFPFRLTLLQKCFLIIGLVSELVPFLENTKWKKHISIAASIIFVVSISLRLNKNILQRSIKSPAHLDEVSHYLATNYAPGTDVIYLDTEIEAADDVFDPLTRKSQMDVYFVNKFLPFSPGKIIEWQRRLDLIARIRKTPADVVLLKNEKVKVIVSRMTYPDEHLKLKTNIGDIKIYEIVVL